ncbi:carboxypeptidase-like regulatory domain-containing protein [Candidatus Manganitrophus noduliformans]|uniref:Carboxypeptidase regulatory-like domain-containing protein n=1 Tax=Candidatus Manganitrophus noduliformans TaxID=2606439 RepID=A0A7X6IDV4_9BACT|nr:carboxypeptidase-like regulatory domain-containing protein [Candidatus Manganitrophus noduliformans]NKE73776.1 carboxypeptidase regulatory-like domain-containing protein [Candidatus Manganitrophus noduliformans]
MHERNRIRTIVMLLLFSLVLQSCGGGGGSSGGNPPAGAITVSGTAATGAPVGNATITIKDATGASKTATTGTDGKYTIDVSGMTAPFLAKVDLPGGTALYSVGSAAGVVNIHPLTDLIIRTWYEVQNGAVDTAFSDPAAAPPPTATELAVIVSVIKDLVSKWLVDAGLDLENFDLISTPFDADQSGFDGFLDDITVDTTNRVISVDTDGDGTDEQVTNLDLDGDDDGTNGDITAATTIVVNGTTSTSFTSAFIPTTATEREGVAGALATLQSLAATATAKGADLAATDLLPLYDSNYRHRGLDENQDAAGFADDLRGTTIESFIVERVLSFDSTNNIISISGRVILTQDGVTVEEIVDEDGDGLIFKKQSDGRWLFYGNQERARAQVGVITERRMLGITCPSGCDGVYYALKVQVGAPVGEIASATITGLIGGSQQTLPLTSTGTFTDDGVNTEHFDLQDSGSWWYQLSGPSAFPPAGTVYTLTVTFADSNQEVYTRVLGASTSEAFNLQSGVEATVGHGSGATLGNPVTLSWTLPVSFPIEEVFMYGSLKSTGGVGCDVEGPLLASTATSGTITLPTTCNGQSVEVNPSYPSINVVVQGKNGEETSIWYAFQ